MASATTGPLPGEKSLQDAGLKAELQRLRRTDNVTNWYYILRTYLYLFAVIGGTVWFYQYQSASGISFWWNVPVTLLAVVLVGAGQHQLSGLAHEGVHHTLFRNKYLNDLASDWFCMFPLFSSTYHYRLQHLAHHQFVNDPDRDPDISQLRTSGHWLDFPVARKAFLAYLARQLWAPNLLRFMRVRAAYNATGTDRNPYLRKGVNPSKTAVKIGLLYLALLAGALTGLYYAGDPVLLAAVPSGLWVAFCAVFALLPSRHYHRSRVRPLIPTQVMTILRITFISLVFNALAWATFLTGAPAGLYYLLLWVVPLFTSFALFMILRQLVQHGNGGRGWLTNTRVFFVNPFIRFAVFPAGQDYHLPHHMYASVPHYRLPELHSLLMRYPDYAGQGVVVEGYFYPPQKPKRAPTVLDVLENPRAGQSPDIYIDNSVLEAGDFTEPDAILEEARESAAAPVPLSPEGRGEEGIPLTPIPSPPRGEGR